MQGFEPVTFQSRVRRSNHWAIPAPMSWLIKEILNKVEGVAEWGRFARLRFRISVGAPVFLWIPWISIGDTDYLSMPLVYLSLLFQWAMAMRKEEEEKRGGQFWTTVPAFPFPFLPLPEPCTTCKLTDERFNFCGWTAIHISTIDARHFDLSTRFGSRKSKNIDLSLIKFCPCEMRSIQV